MIHTETTLLRENHINRWWKHLTAVSDGRLMVAHAHMLLLIELQTKILLL